MKIKEHHINAVLDMIDQDDFDMEGALKKVDETLPNILAYSVSDSFELLTAEESDYFEYLGLTILISIMNNVDGIKDKSIDEIGEMEERMWEMMEAQKSKEFNKRVDVFFQSSKEEELFAFVEDGLTPEDNDFVSAAGRELMFVGLATMIEALCN